MINEEDIKHDGRSLAQYGRGQEVKRRTAISRLYYGVYHRALMYARSKGYRFDKNAGLGRHAHLIQELASLSDDEEIQEMVHQIDTLRSFRVESDYFLENDILVNDVDDAVNIADEIFEIVPKNCYDSTA